jgi:hypothetical protein
MFDKTQTYKEDTMSCSVIHDTIRSELEETSSVYSMVVDTSGAPNMDYAGYACHVALNRFQQLLENPNLSTDQLESMMRKVVRKYAIEDTEKKWSAVMARYMTRHANAN